jgi:hypothetical protein
MHYSDALVRRSGAATAAASAAALACYRYGLFVSCLRSEIRNDVFNRDRDRRRGLRDDADPGPGVGESQLIGTECGLGVFPFQPNCYQFLEQLYRDDLTYAARCSISCTSFGITAFICRY